MNCGKIIKEEYDKFKIFGPSIAAYDILSRATNWSVFYEKKHKVILDYLQNKYAAILEKYKTMQETDDCISDDFPIWVFWYQGFENAPEIVKACLKSLKQCAGKHPVIELSKDNYHNYIQIPDHIEEKRMNGDITLAHFSDILRVSLLKEYGGCWTDATIFFNEWMQDDLSTLQWYSIKEKPEYMDPRYVSEYRWTTYFFCCSKNNVIAKYMQEMYFLYWKEHQKVIDYFLMDYLFALGYQCLPELRKQIDNAPFNNPDVNWLNAHLKDHYNNVEWENVTRKTTVFKLNWRADVSSDQDTYYSKILLSKEKEI